MPSNTNDALKKLIVLTTLNEETELRDKLCELYDVTSDISPLSSLDAIISSTKILSAIITEDNELLMGLGATTLLPYCDTDSNHFIKIRLSTLLYAALHPDTLNIILTLIPESERKNTFVTPNNIGVTALHCAATNDESLQIILEYYPENTSWLQAIEAVNHHRKSVLHYAANNSKSLSIVLNRYPKTERLAAVMTRDNMNCSALTFAHLHPELLKIIFDSLPEPDRFTAATATDRFENNNLLQRAISADNNCELLSIILNALPSHDRLLAIQSVSDLFKKVLCEDKYQELFEIILDALPETDRLTVILDPSIFHSALDKDPALFNTFQNYLKRTTLQTLIQPIGNEGYTLLHFLARYPDPFKTTLTALPKSDRLAALNASNRSGYNVLRQACWNTKVFLVTLDILFDLDDPLTAVTTRDQQNKTLLYYVAIAPYSFDSLKIIFDRLKPSDRLRAECTALLQHVTDNTRSLNLLLNQYSTSTERMTAINFNDHLGHTALLQAASKYPESLGIILNNLIDEDQFATLKTKINATERVIDKLVGKNIFLISKDIRDIVIVYGILSREPDNFLSSLMLLGQGNSSQLRYELMQQKNIIDVKNSLLNYLSRNIKQTLTATLLNALELSGDKNNEKMAELKKRWQILDSSQLKQAKN